MNTYTVTRDGETLAVLDTENEAWAYLHRIQGQSIDHAVRHEGYDIIYPNGGRLSQGCSRNYVTTETQKGADK